MAAFAQAGAAFATCPSGKRPILGGMPAPLFDELIHERTRLQLTGLLAAVVEAEFGTLRDSLGVSDSALSKHLRVLEDAGYLTTRRQRDGSRAFTLAALTDEGRHAFCGHVAAIQRLAGVASMRAGGRRVPAKHVPLSRRPTG